jgi:hypothetical protein
LTQPSRWAFSMMSLSSLSSPADSRFMAGHCHLSPAGFELRKTNVVQGLVRKSRVTAITNCQGQGRRGAPSAPFLNSSVMRATRSWAEST